MKRILLISILFFLPATASAYSLLQPENFVRLNQASFLLAEEQPAQSPAGQPALDMTQEEKSPDLRFGGKPKILKPRSYLFPIIWDLAPIPALWALALKCSTEKPNINENDCSDKLTVATILGTPFWSIPINAYVQDKNSVSASIFLGKLFILLLAFGINKIYYESPGPSGWSCMGDDEANAEECAKYKAGEKGKENYFYLVITASVLQIAETITHVILVKENNDLYKKQQLENQVFITPYVGKDRAGLAFQLSF